ncbi:MAG: putative metal-binding motif-containing protein [Deltaproteobacteria bacterium]|nr:putative metal-binding motif-containing protein [Deltaproteobacteria bacterium]
MLRAPSFFQVLVTSGLLALGACGAEKEGSGFTPSGGKDTGTTTPGTDADDPDGASEDDGGLSVGDIGTPETIGGCLGADPLDCDNDGYRASDGDCNEKDGTINPDAYDFLEDGVDNDCDGTVDNPVTECAATPGSTDPMQFARAADLCTQRSKSKKYGGTFDPVFKVEFGKISAGFGSSTTKMEATKILSQFGDNKPRKGTTLFGMQSGPILAEKPRESKPIDMLPVQNACAAMGLKDADCKSLTTGSSIPISASVQDFQEVRMFIRVPSNAKAMVFDFAFFSTEFSEYWNSPFNDAFFALVTSKKVAGLNVAKDSKGKALTVNSGFFQLCPAPPGPAGLVKPEALSAAPCVGVDGAPAATPPILGTLKKTFFDGEGIGSTDDTISAGGDAGTSKHIYGGGSGWLSTKFEVEPGESMVVRFMVHDTSDGALDSAAIVDNIRWEQAKPKVPTGEVERPPM